MKSTYIFVMSTTDGGEGSYFKLALDIEALIAKHGGGTYIYHDDEIRAALFEGDGDNSIEDMNERYEEGATTFGALAAILRCLNPDDSEGTAGTCGGYGKSWEESWYIFPA